MYLQTFVLYNNSKSLSRWEKEGNGSRVEWGDVHLMLSGGLVRGVVVVLDEEGQIREDRFELRTR